MQLLVSTTARQAQTWFIRRLSLNMLAGARFETLFSYDLQLVCEQMNRIPKQSNSWQCCKFIQTPYEQTCSGQQPHLDFKCCGARTGVGVRRHLALMANTESKNLKNPKTWAGYFFFFCTLKGAPVHKATKTCFFYLSVDDFSLFLKQQNNPFP